MSLQRKMNNKQLLDALDYIDDRFVAELVTSIKPPETETGEPMRKRALLRSAKQVALLAACAVLLSAIIPVVSMVVNHTTPTERDFAAGANPYSNESDIMFYRKVARRTLDNGWVYTFTREGMKDGDDSQTFKYIFYGINIKYKYAEKYGGISSEENLNTGWLLFGDSSEAEKRDAQLVHSILSNDKTDEELLALNPDDYTFEVLDKDMFFELMREALTGEAQEEGQDQSYWDKPYFAFLNEKDYIDGYKFQICFLNETGLIDELFIDVLYKTGDGDMEYVQLSDLVESGQATDEQVKVFELIQSIANDIKENTNYIFNADSYRETVIDGVDFSRLCIFLEDIHNNRFEDYSK